VGRAPALDRGRAVLGLDLEAAGPVIPRPPAWLLPGAIAVYLVHALGLFLLGATLYVGRAWFDQYNYVAMADYFAYVPFGTTPAELQQRPYLLFAEPLKSDRIGQSVFHALVTLTAFSDSKTVFEPVILLVPPLTVLAIAYLGLRLGLPPGIAAGAGLVGGLMPALAQLHLESFLSQALATPFLICWLGAIGAVPSRRRGDGSAWRPCASRPR
jgi:hypothetical protein